MKTSPYAAALLLTAQTLLANCHISETATAQGRAGIVLENDLIRAVILPSSCARVASFVLKSTDEEFLTPLDEAVTEISPLLPKSVRSNGAGFKDWIWGNITPSGVVFSVKILTSTPDEVCVEFQGTLAVFDLRKVFRLKRNSTVLEQEITFTNPTTQKLNLDYWAHLIVNSKVFSSGPPARSVLVAAIDAQPAFIRGKKTESFGSRDVVTAQIASSYHFFAPIEPWVAKLSPTSGTAIVLQFSPCSAGDVLASVWQSGEASSLELIFPQSELAPQESKTFQVNIAAAPQVAHLLGVAENFLVCARQAEIGILPLIDVSATEWQLPPKARESVSLPVPKIGALTFYSLGLATDFLAGELSLTQNSQVTKHLFSPGVTQQSLSEP